MNILILNGNIIAAALESQSMRYIWPFLIYKGPCDALRGISFHDLCILIILIDQISIRCSHLMNGIDTLTKPCLGLPILFREYDLAIRICDACINDCFPLFQLECRTRNRRIIILLLQDNCDRTFALVIIGHLCFRFGQSRNVYVITLCLRVNGQLINIRRRGLYEVVNAFFQIRFADDAFCIRYAALP